MLSCHSNHRARRCCSGWQLQYLQNAEASIKQCWLVLRACTLAAVLAVAYATVHNKSARSLTVSPKLAKAQDGAMACTHK